MRIAILTILPALLPGLAAADDFAVPAPATEVIVYLSGIEVTRHAELDLPAGAHRILLPVMPGSAGAPRIEVAGAVLASAATISDGIVDGRSLFTPAQETVHDIWRAATDSASSATDDRIRAAAAVRSAEDALAFLRSVSGATLDRLDAEAIGAVAGAVSGGVTAAEVARADAAEALRVAEEAQVEAGRAVAQAKRDLDATGANFGPVTLLALSVDAAQAGPVRVTLHDFSGAGGWSLAYEIDLRADDTVALVRRATVAQGTGLPLDGVTLRLSTADPYAQVAPSEVFPDLARAEDIPLPVPVPQARLQAESDAAADISAGSALKASVDTDGPIVAYDFPVPVDIPVSGDRVTVSLDETRLAARVFNRAVPRTDTTAFRVAEVTNDTGEPLLAGPATLYREGRKTGETYLPLLPAGDGADLSFGPVEHLRLEYRALDNETGETGYFSTSGTRRQDLVFRIRNLSDAPETVETLFALPYSEQEDLEVRVTTAPDPDQRDVDEKRGVAQWTLAMPAQGEAEVRIGVDMEWPAGQRLDWQP